MRRLIVRRVHSAGDGGFILLESIIAMAIITLIMSAVGAEFVNGMISTSQQRAQQAAVQLADSAVEQVRSLHPSDLLGGRDRASVTAQFAAAAAPVQPWLAQMDQAVDTTAAAGSGATATIPTTGTPQKPGIVNYTVNDYLGWCYIPPSGSTSCVPKASVGGASWTAGVGCSTDGAPLCYLRAVVAVTWTSSRCGTSVCSYVTSTLVSAASDPTFKLNQPLPAAPIILATSDQIVAVGDTVSLQLLVTNNTGVPPFTWALTTGTLPTNLALSPTGLISGTVGAPAGTQTVTVTVTDAFLRTATDTFTWTIEPPIALNPPGAQANTTADTVNLTLTASGGDGAPYTWSDPTGSLPPGLSMSASGVVTGRPTTRGNYPVQLTILDKSGVRSGTGTFTWTIAYPPLAASNPGSQASTINTPIPPTVQLNASGGSGNYVWSDSPRSLPAGLSISASGLITGTPTATGGPVTVTLTVTDATAVLTKTVVFTWIVLAQPTVTAPPAQADTLGQAVSIPLTTSCPNASCTYTLNSGPTNLSVTSAGVITGTIGGTAGSYATSVTVTDADGATVTSSSFTWVVSAQPSLTGLAATAIGETATPSVPITYSCPAGSCTIAFSGALASGVLGIGLSASAVIVTSNSATSVTVPTGSGTVYLNGLLSTTAVTTGASKNYGVTLAIADANGYSPSSSSAIWTAYAKPTISTPGIVPTSQNATPTKTLTYACPGACTVTVSGLPSGIGLTAAPTSSATSNTTLAVATTSNGTLYLNGKVSNTATKMAYPVTLTIAYSTTTITSVGTWTVS